jgi:hypothetical protein
MIKKQKRMELFKTSIDNVTEEGYIKILPQEGIRITRIGEENINKE